MEFLCGFLYVQFYVYILGCVLVIVCVCADVWKWGTITQCICKLHTMCLSSFASRPCICLGLKVEWIKLVKRKTGLWMRFVLLLALDPASYHCR